MKEIQYFAYKQFKYIVKIDHVNNYNIIELKPYMLSDYNLSINDYKNITDVLDSFIVLPEDVTKSFYKSFEDVISKTRFELLIDQLKHYDSTYGTNTIYKDENEIIPFIPNNSTDLPDMFLQNIKLIEVKSLEDFKKDFVDYIYSVTTVENNDVENIFKIIKYLCLNINFNKVKSKELKSKAFVENLYIPNNAEEFLKGIVAFLTNSSLYIKNNETLQKISNNIKLETSYNFVYTKFKNYIKLNGYTPLAEIFNRNKNIFINLKHKKLKTIINKISKYSKKYHKAKTIPDYMNVLSKVHSFDKLLLIFNSLNTSYLVKIYNAANFYLELKYNNLNYSYYHIRNGKGWFTEKSLKNINISYLESIKVLLKQIIKKRITHNAKRYKISINSILLSDIDYAIPESEKRFIGDIPYGSELVLTEDSFSIGVYWENKNNNQVDLDLSMTSNRHKYGWDRNYHNYDTNNDDFKIIFSGDMTDAENGAFEVFNVKNIRNAENKNKIYFLNLNYYNYNPELIPLDYKFLISTNAEVQSQTEISDIFNNIVFQTSNKLKYISEILGYLKITKDNSKFIFTSTSLNKNASSTIEEEGLIKVIDVYSNKLKFSDLFEIFESEKITHEHLSRDILIKLIQN